MGQLSSSLLKPQEYDNEFIIKDENEFSYCNKTNETKGNKTTQG
jgi:hypothetical protein